MRLEKLHTPKNLSEKAEPWQEFERGLERAPGEFAVLGGALTYGLLKNFAKDKLGMSSEEERQAESLARMASAAEGAYDRTFEWIDAFDEARYKAALRRYDELGASASPQDRQRIQRERAEFEKHYEEMKTKSGERRKVLSDLFLEFLKR